MHKRYENPKCTYAFILYSLPMIKSLPKVLILYPFGHLMNFQIYTWNFLPFKTISPLTIVCYHQNPIKRTLGLTISLFFMMTNLGYLGEKEISPSNQSWINQFKIYEFKTEINKTWKFSMGNNVKHENSISYIVKSNVHETKLNQADATIMICKYRSPRS